MVGRLSTVAVPSRQQFEHAFQVVRGVQAGHDLDEFGNVIIGQMSGDKIMAAHFSRMATAILSRQLVICKSFAQWRGVA